MGDRFDQVLKLKSLIRKGGFSDSSYPQLPNRPHSTVFTAAKQTGAGTAVGEKRSRANQNRWAGRRPLLGRGQVLGDWIRFLEFGQ